jgi:glycosyltransferase involved in cell wall biosynthesis
VKLWIAGEGNIAELEWSDAQYSEMNSGVSLLGLRRDIPDLLDAADGFVLSSAWEGMPLVLGEAMAMGMPVAATRVGGVAELVGDAGWVVPPHDSEALSGAMHSIMAMDEVARKDAGQFARERIQTHFSMDARAVEWESLYAHLLRDRTQ